MWMIVFFLCWVVRIDAVCDLQDMTEMEVTKYSGESVLLPCSCTDLQAQGVRWVKDYMQIDLNKPADRIQMTNQDSPGNLSLLISDLTKEDEGLYTCIGYQYSYRDFTLTVTGCTLMLNQTILEIERSSGESALLPCLCSPLRAKPESVRWMTTSRSGSSYTEISNTTGRYRGRVQMLNRHSPGNVSLLISDLSEKDQGTYICVVDKHHAKYFNLLVKANTLTTQSSPGKQTPATKEKDAKSRSGTTSPLCIASFISVLLLVLLLGGLAFIFWRYKGQRERQMGNDNRQRRGTDQECDMSATSTYEELQHRYSAGQMYSTIGQNTGVQVNDHEGDQIDLSA